VLAVLAEGDDHLTATDIAEAVRAEDPRAHLSTIYRTLERLRECGVVDHIHLAHGPVVFHLHRQVHHHLLCVGCGAVIDVTDDVFEPLTDSLARRYGFTLQPGHVALSGWCRDCASASPRA
jgi:Fur family ferric uptake transcriptional regulator